MGDTDRAARRVLVLGGTSEIALATLDAMGLGRDASVVLAARAPHRLRKVTGRLPCQVEVDTFDARDPASVVGVIDRAFDGAEVDVVLVAFGVLGNQAVHENDPVTAADVLDVDVTAQVVALLEVGRLLRRQGHGTVVVFSSIAAVRPRRANVVYGAGKAAVDAAARGVADSLYGTGVRVVLVRPGFVRGRMTAHLSPAPFATTPEKVGRAVAAALDGDRGVVWVPGVLRGVAVAMRLTPRVVWRRLRR